MAEDDEATAPPADRHPHWGRRILIGAGAVVGVLLVVLAGYAWLNTDSGRGFVAQQVRGLNFANGLKIDVARIDGSIFGRMELHGLALRDPQGVFLTAPDATLDWRPLAYLGNHVDIRAASVPTARLYRLPAFKPTPSTGKLLPDLDIDIDRLAIGRLRIDPPVTGKRHLVGLNATAHLSDGRLQLGARGRAFTAPGVAGGDRLALTLDAVPDRNRLNIDLKLNAPANGLVAAFAGLDQPVQVALSGKGDWQAWNGMLTGRVGGDPLANVQIAARNGAFYVMGPIRPGLFLTGPGRAMLEPVTRIDARAKFGQRRRVQLDAQLGSDNFTAAAKGMVDLAANRFGDFGVDFRLLKPSVIATNLSGADAVAHATLNGDFSAPDIAYRVTARQLGFGATRVDNLAVNGSAALDKDHWLIPVHGTAGRISGVAASVAPLLTNVRLDGDLAYANGRILSDNLRLRSDRIDATAIVVADLDKALYTGALNGRVNGYQVASIGVFNLSTNVDLKAGSAGGFRLSGRVTARSTRLINDSVRSFLGGNALIDARVGYDSNGVATVDALSVAAPLFRLTGGRGRYGANGSIQFAGQGRSASYGPFTIAADGSVAQPLVRLRASRPGVGIGLADLDARVRGDNGAYLVTATAGSDYGPVAANVAVMTGKGPLRIDLRQGTKLAGVGLTGQVTQTSAGPFSGTLAANGSGIDGRVQLSALNGKQRAVVAATANNASLPGKVGLSARRAIINADIVLYDQPQISGQAQIAGTQIGDLYFAAARIDGDYRGGNGQAKLLVEGRTRYPFRLAGNAALTPNLWRVALKGRLNGIDVATRGPIRIIPTRGSYTLEPSTLSVGSGSIQLAGSYGNGLNVRSRLDGFDLALANPFFPGLGLGGTATGTLDFAQANPNAFPTADAQLSLGKFSRTSVVAVSEPVDITLVGRLLPDGGQARAVVKRRGATVGRLQANLQPLGPGAGSWTTRMLAAPLSGGIRFNGPADVLFSLAALPDQHLTGPLGVAADFSGHVRQPMLTGVVKGAGLTYENGTYGTRLTNMQLDGRFTNDKLRVDKLTARAGSGTVSASGSVSLSSAEGFPIQLGIDMNNAQLARGNDLSTQATGRIDLVNGPNQPATVRGHVELPETHYTIVRQGSAKVATLTGVRRKPALDRERITGSPEPLTTLPTGWRLDVDVTADNKLYVGGMGLNSEWATNIHVGGTSSAPELSGNFTLVRGTLGFAGRSFDLQQGRIDFSGGKTANPSINIVASGDVEDVTINITITGRADNPQIAFTSTPSLPQDELMSRILFGSSVGQLSAIQAVQLAASLNSLRGGGGGLNPLGVLQSASGIDRIRILGGDEKTGRGTSLALGQYITNNVYVEIVTDARGYTATQLELTLSKALSILSQTSSFGSSSLNLRYRKNY